VAVKQTDVSGAGVSVLAQPGALTPIANLEQVTERSTTPVLVVTSLPAMLAADEFLPRYVATTWTGAPTKADWEPLAGRDVTIWPDRDAKSQTAARTLARHLYGIAKSVRTVVFNGDGRELIDTVESQQSGETTYGWIDAHAKVLAPPPQAKPIPATTEQSVSVIWQSLPLSLNAKGEPHPNVSNGSIFLRFLEDFKGKIWLDTFRDKIYHTTRGGSPTLWTDSDTRRICVYFQQTLRMPKFSAMTAFEAVQHAAECDRRNSVIQWLESLEWDGRPRLNHWLVDTLGIERNEYSEAISRNWAIAMVRRAFQPGCKFDHMPVLEGKQGLSKTSFLEVLGGEWYKSIPTAFGEKDFLQAIQGAWIVEIPDMTGFSKREHSAILATITIRVDEYRKSYGRVVESHPRVAIFAATSERDNYLNDIRGRRRYWPLRCTSIEVEALATQRKQIFAEALIAHRNGEPHWVMPAQHADAEQMQRAEPDIWTEAILEKAEKRWLENLGDRKRANITAYKLLEDIGLTVDRQTQKDRNRVSEIMQINGWDIYRAPHARLWYKR
jgi:hypothetical protein